MRNYLTLTVSTAWEELCDKMWYVMGDGVEQNLINRYIIIPTKEAGNLMIFHSHSDGSPNMTMIHKFYHLHNQKKVDHFLCCCPNHLPLQHKKYHAFPNAIEDITLENDLSYSIAENSQVLIMSAKVKKRI